MSIAQSKTNGKAVKGKSAFVLKIFEERIGGQKKYLAKPTTPPPPRPARRIGLARLPAAAAVPGWAREEYYNYIIQNIMLLVRKQRRGSLQA